MMPTGTHILTSSPDSGRITIEDTRFKKQLSPGWLSKSKGEATTSGIEAQTMI